MTKKTDKTAMTVAKKPANTLEVLCDRDEDRDKALARTYLSPTVQGGLTIKNLHSKNDDLTLMALITTLRDESKTAIGGDLKRAEAMLLTQAHTLDALFNNLAQRASNNMGQYIDAAERYMRLALKAQSQCRSNLEALAEMKNPKPYIQNNRAQYQQVNNGPVTSGNPRAGKQKPANELLEDNTHEHQRMDARTAQAAGRDDQEVETVGAEYRAKD